MGLFQGWFIRVFLCHQGLMHTLHVLLCHLQCVSHDGCRWQKTIQAAPPHATITGRKAGEQILPQGILYIKEENLSQKPPYVSLARCALHSISKPIPDNRNPGSMIGLGQSNMSFLLPGYSHLLGTHKEEGVKGTSGLCQQEGGVDVE